ncbi:MAG: hypothetical protein IV093_11875 [Rubrivivax sp.]|nr:hypothetical protein [Rubrivivax sp.]
MTLLSPRPWLAESLARDRTLTLFGLLMWAALLPAALAWGLDGRELRGLSVWLKPIKFMASIGLFALTTAWFIGLLPPAARERRAARSVVWLIVGFGGAEIAYITLQAALGQASHYNFSSPMHIALYSAMGFGALAMTASQPLLAWLILRHGRTDVAPAWRLAVLLGLVLTFVLGAGAGGLLGSMQPPAGAGLPLVGWHLGGGDLRPAHFLGLHAQQFLPLAGLAVVAWPARRARWALVLFAVFYAAAWAWALQRGLHGAVLTVPDAAG